MIIEPRIRDNFCLSAHPLGCAAQVAEQIEYARSRGPIEGPKRALIIGASNGYGLAARIVSAFCCGADTIGLAYERPGRPKRPATPGWYNSEAFSQLALEAGRGAWNLNGDAFGEDIKAQTLELVREHLGEVDLLVYSIAAPRRQDPETGELYTSAIKPIGAPYSARTVDVFSGEISELSTPPASEEEIAHTVQVMGGADWRLWIEKLQSAGVLAKDFMTVAFSYIGPDCTRAIYRDGTIGKAKEDLERTAAELTRALAPLAGRAYVSVNKALVTRASAVIPGVPLYISLLYKVMKAKGLHENCIQQMDRMYRDVLFAGGAVPVDAHGRIRMDDWEMREDVQREVRELWDRVDGGNLEKLADLEGFRREFLQHHGFEMEGIDYGKEVEPDIF